MMIKKKLGLLAASVLVASGAQAAFTDGSQSFGPGCTYSCWAGTDSDVVFFAHDSSGTNGSYFVNLSALGGITVDSLIAGTSFNFDLATTGINLGNYDSWGMFATSNDLSTTYSYGRSGIAMGGIVTDSNALAGSTGGVESATDAVAGFNTQWFSQITAALGGADEGGVGTADPADFDNEAGRSPNPGTELTSLAGSANLYLYGILDTSPEAIYTEVGATDSSVQYNLLLSNVSIANNFTAAAVIPVPAAAWLFGSALLGLGVSRRRK